MAMDTQTLLMKFRSDFVSWAINNGLTFSLAMLGECQFIVDPALKFLAGISNRKGRRIYVHPLFFNLYQLRKECAYMVVLHELRHLLQISDFSATKEMIDMSRLDTIIRERITKVFGDNNKDVQPLTEGQIDKLRHQVFNVGADAALHEDLLSAFGQDVFDTINKFLAKVFNPTILGSEGKPEEDCIITVPSLGKMFRKVLDRNKDWLFYANEYVNHLAKEVEECDDGEFIQLAQDWTLAAKLAQYMSDMHDLSGEFDGEFDGLRNKLREEARKLGPPRRGQQRNDGAMNPGLGYGSDNYEFEAKKRLNRRIKHAIDLIKRKISKIAKGEAEENLHYSYSRINKILPELPGRRSIIVKRRVKCLLRVLVMDTSGSMWCEEFLAQMVTMAKYLLNRRQVQRVYCCDVALYQFEFNKNRRNRARIRGGGGTEFSTEHVEQLLRDFDVKQGIEILYATDGLVYGIDQVERDERVVLHKILIPNLLNVAVADGKKDVDGEDPNVGSDGIDISSGRRF